MPKADWHYLYDTKRWKALRLYHMGTEPICRMCKQVDRITPVAVVDHVKPHKGDIELFFDDTNLQSLCVTHHNATKQRQEHRGHEQGCDATGIPMSRRTMVH